MRWLILSLTLSLVLTVLVNIGLRAFPGAGRRAAHVLDELASPRSDAGPEPHRRVRVFVPWKAMIVASVVLTILANLVLRAL